jgi:hypothetical protein
VRSGKPSQDLFGLITIGRLSHGLFLPETTDKPRPLSGLDVKKGTLYGIRR